VEAALRSDVEAGNLVAALLPRGKTRSDAAMSACLLVGKALTTIIKAGAKYLKEG